MHVHRSNRTEKLVAVLCEVVARPLESPFARETIVVQGRGMERWLAMQLARRLGVWANPDFPFPRRLIERAFAAAAGGDESAGAVYEPETLTWAVADLLPQHLDHPAFESIRSYLASDERGLRRLQLAQRIATTFDQYVVFRPEMVLRWESRAEEHWQAILWRALVERLGPHHLAAREERFRQRLERLDRLEGFPERVSLFGLSTLPPLYVRVLFALSRVVEVHLFVLSPSREYWAEIRSRREILRTIERRGGDETEEELHLSEGNPLLASLGRLGRDFQAVLEAGGHYVEDDNDLYVDPGTCSMLATLQSDILNLLERRHTVPEGRAHERRPALPLDPDDRTITVHSCHSPMREVEVLHDQLVALFQEIPDLEPRDVVVMTPSIELYAPLIEAVFGEIGTRPQIPYRIADRGSRATDEIADAFARLLEVLDGRMTAADVLDLLRIAAIRERFGIEAEEVDVVRAWIDQAGVRWGIDAAHRRAHGQPEIAQNTWRFGLDRLLVGYAMPGEERRMFAGTLPYDDVEGSAGVLLGKVADFCTTLFRFHDELSAPRTLDEWRDDLGRLLGAMVASNDHTADQHHAIRKALESLAERARSVEFTDRLSFDAARDLVRSEIAEARTSRGFLSGGVTFCELVPMRAIPFRVVCLLGMNGDAFPRVRRPLGFDVVARHPRRGDRSAREDDRYLFLEALLSARDRLWISYVGQSVRDNTELPPSVVVSELLDTLGESFIVPDDGASSDDDPNELPSERAQRRIRERVVVRHPLQPFSPRYFSGEEPRLVSYAAAYYCGAQALVGPRHPAPRFVPAPLAAEAPREVTVDELVRFFEHPARAFLQRSLLLSLGKDAAPLDNREPLELDQLDRWAIGQQVLTRVLEGEDRELPLTILRGKGLLPLGVPGDCVYRELVPEVEEIAQRARRATAGEPRPPFEVDAELDGVRITGRIGDLFERGHVRVQFSRLGRRSEVATWIRHLLIDAFAPPDVPRCTTIVGRPAGSAAYEVCFRPAPNAQELLRRLLALYRIGSMLPLPFFPSTSRVYVAALRAPNPKEPARALEDARRAWDSERGDSSYERTDDYNRLAFAGCDPLEAAVVVPDVDAPLTFASVAEDVFGPLLDHREELS